MQQKQNVYLSIKIIELLFVIIICMREQLSNGCYYYYVVKCLRSTGTVLLLQVPQSRFLDSTQQLQAASLHMLLYTLVTVKNPDARLLHI